MMMATLTARFSSAAAATSQPASPANRPLPTHTSSHSSPAHPHHHASAAQSKAHTQLSTRGRREGVSVAGPAFDVVQETLMMQIRNGAALQTPDHDNGRF